MAGFRAGGQGRQWRSRTGLVSVSSPDTLDVRVDLSGAVHFPVLVDPTLEQSNGAVNNVNVWPGWQHYATSAGWGFYGYGGLLQVLVDPARNTYPAGNYGQWYVTSHGDAPITRVEIFGAEHQQATKSTYVAGTYNSNGYVGGWTTNGYSGTLGGNPYTDSSVFDGRPVLFCAQPNYGGSDANPNNPLCNESVGAYGFTFALYIDNPGLDVANDARITGALVTYLDNTPPDKLSIAGAPSGWMQSLPSLSIYGHDTGLGVQTFTANAAGQQQSQTEGNCFTSTTGYFCPASDTKSFNFASPPEGQYNLTGTVTDEVGNQASGQAQVRIDRTAPVAQFDSLPPDVMGTTTITGAPHRLVVKFILVAR